MSPETREMLIGFAIGIVLLAAWIAAITVWEPFAGGAFP